MKKLSLLFALILTLSIASQAQIKIGAKAGLNINNIATDFKDSDFEPDTKMGLGFHFGVTGEYGLNDQMAIQSGLLFTRKGYSTDLEADLPDGVSVDGYDRYMINYLEIPIHFAYKINDLQIYAGPYFAFGIGGKNKWDATVSGGGAEISDDGEISYKPFFGEVAEGDLGDDEDAYRGLDAGLNIGIGYQMDKLLINAGYSIGLGNVTPDYEGDFDAADYKVQNRVISVSVSYFFMEL